MAAMRSRYGVALVLAPLLLGAAGCSGDQDPGSQPSPTESTSSSAPAGATLPASFPVDEVPLVDGEIGEVLENESLNSYLVKVYPDTDFATAFADATAQLQGAGFTMGKDVISAGPSSSTADFTSDEWFVIITGGLPDKVMLQYTVYPAGG